MASDFSAQTVGAFLVGLCVGAGTVWFMLPNDYSHHNHHDNHPIADPYDTEYHVHADFHIYINDERLDLNQPELMTTSQQELHEHMHLHDENGEVLHVHAENITFAEFLSSINIQLTEECVEYNDTAYCTSETEQLAMYVNGERYEDPLTEYVPLDDDSILLYFGTNEPEPGVIESYVEGVPNDACYYSGTCPERGVAPPESCGLTCEL